MGDKTDYEKYHLRSPYLHMHTFMQVYIKPRALAHTHTHTHTSTQSIYIHISFLFLTSLSAKHFTSSIDWHWLYFPPFRYTYISTTADAVHQWVYPARTRLRKFPRSEWYNFSHRFLKFYILYPYIICFFQSSFLVFMLVSSRARRLISHTSPGSPFCPLANTVTFTLT